MKRCPHCRRAYSDESLKYCLDDGNVLLDGPGSGENPTEELRELATSESPTKLYAEPESARPPVTSQNVFSGSIGRIVIGGIAVVTVLAAAGFWLYWPAQPKQITSIAVMPFSHDSGTPDAEYLS